MKDAGDERHSHWGRFLARIPRLISPDLLLRNLYHPLSTWIPKSPPARLPANQRRKGHAGGIGKCMGQQQVRGYCPEVG